MMLFFDEQVARRPRAIALIFAGEMLTYRELDDRANRLARHLRSMGVETEARVGVFMNRSLEMVIAILAILKAGGAYVPLDPDYPAERTALILEDSRACAVITTEQLRRRLPEVATRIVSADGAATAIANRGTEPVPCSTMSGNLAYVIYTSGSTGQPKGVMVEHRNVVSFFAAMDRLLGTDPGVWLAVTSIAFDISVLELLWTLARGFTVVLHGEGSTHTIATEILRYGVTHFQSTPSLARMLAADPRSLAALGRVQKILLGGDALTASLVGMLRRAIATEIYNMYGPTEATVWSTAYRIPGAHDFGTTIPIGRPLANARVYVLDPQMQPVSDGEAGELFIGGEGVVRGYWERPEQSAERFVPDPFAGEGRMYRTGDVARFLPDGNLEFLGRTDFQVKLRGYRIELGEIEAVLEAQPSVRQAVVVAREDRPGDQRLVAYIVHDGRKSLAPSAFRAALESKLPQYMVPAHFVYLDRMPLTPNGKIDRNGLPAVSVQKAAVRPTPSWDESPRQRFERMIMKVWADALGVEQVGTDENLFDLGATSLMMPEVQIELQRQLAREIHLLDLFEFHTVRTLAAQLAGDFAIPRSTNRAATPCRASSGRGPMKSSAIAIVGMAGRFPGARNIDEFWRNLRDGVESIRPLSDAELLAAGVAPEVVARPDYVKAAAVLDGVDMFDASFFGLSPKDAAIMDPQHRHFMECAWEAIENAGHPPEGFSGSIGVFAGSGTNGYLIHNLINNRRLMESTGLFLIRQTGNDKDVLASRVSYQLDLRGPALSVQTACSTSLVAVHLACQSLLTCECDMALAGGVTIEIPHSHGFVYREGEILSHDGHCRAFDAASSGTVFSSGVGIVVLRRLEDAITDHDTIHAVILGSAVNNDGQRKVGYLAPSVAGQAEAIGEALGVAGVNAESISYIETHGTGTAVGDPLEIKGLTQAFRRDTDRKGYCAIGSLKTNVGHLDTAAGVAGLIKTVLALRHRQLPASLNFQKPNPHIDFQNSPFYVNGALTGWKSDGRPRRAGVTSLGIGGTNAHVILEEAAELPRPAPTDSHQLIPLSARTEPALAEAAARLAAHLRDNPELRLADVAFTSQVGRMAFEHRRIVVASTGGEAARLLAAPESPRGLTGTAASTFSSSVVFLFSGQGSQYPKMGADLYASQPVFRACLDRCADLLLPHLGLDLRDVLYPHAEHAARHAKQLNRTSIVQPALFSLEYSLAQWWMAVGVRPQAMLGHSIGEYVAACLADVLSLDDALEITALRGRLMEECPPGSMLAVALAEEAIPRSPDLSIAAVNSYQQCVVSGSHDAVAQLERGLIEQGIFCLRLQNARAFHSSMMDPILESFRAQMRRISLQPPRIPYLSNLTGTWITAAEATDPGYWADHLRNTVRFSDCVSELLRQPGRVMIEVGPGQTLASLIREQSGRSAAGNGAKALSSLRRREETTPDTVVLLNALGQLWIGGQTVDWSALHTSKAAMRVPLPTYPFQRKRFWIDRDDVTFKPSPERLSPLLASGGRLDAGSAEAVSERSPGPESVGRWFYERHWRRTEQPIATTLAPECWVVFLDPTGLGRQITFQLRVADHKVIEVTPGRHYKRTGPDAYTIRSGVREDYHALVADLLKRQLPPQRIVHLWSVRARSSAPSLDNRLDLSFYSLLFLAQAIGEEDLSGVDIAVVSDRLHSVQGEPVCDPVCATLLGPTKVIPKEFPGITCRSIDIDSSSQATAKLAVEIIAEHCAPFRDSVVAIRQRERWIESLAHCDLLSGSSRFREKGVYLITGGLGDLGLVIAEELALQFKARLVLLGRTPLPPTEQWKNALEATGTPDRIKQQIRKLTEIQSLGAEVLLVPGDVCRRSDVKRAMDLSLAKFGSINGVIHAAGVVEDSPLLVKSRASAARVLDPKVQGTLVLDEVIREVNNGTSEVTHLDFFALFSSVSSVLAPAGQVDYAAANAFLDSFAISRRGARVFAINWGQWRDVGMAARKSSSHPLLDRRVIDTAAEITYAITLSLRKHWVLAEHRLNTGRAVLPGTCYLEMASAALSRGSFDRGVEFEDVFFRSPFFAAPGESTPARLDLHRNSDGVFRFSVSARGAERIEHASGRIARCQQAPPADRVIGEIAARCHLCELTFDDTHRTEQERFFDFGPRWRCLRSIRIGDDEALADIELPREFIDDTCEYQLHPALLDLATGSALYLIDGYGPSSSLYLPMFYKRATMYRRIPPQFFSHIRSPQKNKAGRDVATFDLSLLDARGRVLAEIEGFSMRLVRDPHDGLGIVGSRMPAPAHWNDAIDDNPLGFIPPAEGAKAFMAIVSSDRTSSVFVFPGGPPAMTSLPDAVARPAATKASSHEALETVFADWWQEVLGHERVGLDDDFFELGGQSLHVVRLFAKIKKTYSIDFDLSTFFEARTIRKLARLVRAALTKTIPDHSSGRMVVPIQASGTQSPLYVVSGRDGHVLAFRKLAFYLGEDQPVYGLVPRGLNGHEPYHRHVEDMAAHYADAIQIAQPEGSVRLLGHSFGGIVAFEVARQLTLRGIVVSFLGLLDTVEPQYSRHVWKSLPFRHRLAAYGTEFKMAARDGDPFGPLRRRLARRISGKISSILHALGRRHQQPGGTIKDVNLNAAANYKPKVYPAALTLFRCTVRSIEEGEDDFLGWGRLVAGGIELHHIPTDHGGIVHEPAVRILADKLGECLNRDPAPAHADRTVAAV